VNEQTWQDCYYASADGLRLYYRDYAAPGSSQLPVLCLHGLTRNSRDFEKFAPRLQAHGRRVLSVDVRGRGRSAYDPAWQNYHPGTYIADVQRLLADAGVERAIFVGTSMGGLMTMIAAMTMPGVVAGAVLNDVGPEVAQEGLTRIAGYVGRMPPVASWDDAVTRVKEVYGHALPGLTDEEWLRYARRGYVEADGVVRLDYDPNIGEALRAAPAAAAPDLWPVYRALRPIPTLAIRGETSDILSVPTFERMQSEKPDLARVTVPRRGHVPLLDESECLEALDAFLSRLP
jgi:pimeloyl-ACP methyl ester carboxylesterase